MEDKAAHRYAKLTDKANLHRLNYRQEKYLPTDFKVLIIEILKKNGNFQRVSEF